MQLIRSELEPQQLDLAFQPQKVKQTMQWYEVGNDDSFYMAALGKVQMKTAWLPSWGKETSTGGVGGVILSTEGVLGLFPGGDRNFSHRRDLF